MDQHTFVPCACYYCEHEDVTPLCNVKGCHQPASEHTAPCTQPHTQPQPIRELQLATH